MLQDDGIIKLQVLEPIVRTYGPEQYTETLCKVVNKNTVTLGARKGTNIPGAVLDLPALTERDKKVRLTAEQEQGGGERAVCVPLGDGRVPD